MRTKLKPARANDINHFRLFNSPKYWHIGMILLRAKMRAYTLVHIDVCVLIIDLTSDQQQHHQQKQLPKRSERPKPRKLMMVVYCY